MVLGLLYIIIIIIYIYITVPNRQRCPFGCNGCVTAVAVGVGIFINNWYHLSSPPQILRRPWLGLERKGLVYI
jgi:hypothetical protein